MHVLVVEDDPAIAQELCDGLHRLDYETSWKQNGADAIQTIKDENFTIVLLDIGLPDIDGYEVCKAIRSLSSVPIIMLTARGDEFDRVLGLELGADDYVTKPFGFRELAARIKAVVRRHHGSTQENFSEEISEDSTYYFDSLQIDLRTRKVLQYQQLDQDTPIHSEEIVLSRKEFEILAYLLEDPGALFTRDQIMQNVWDAHWYGPTKTLDVHIASIRKKLENASLIETVRGVGFRIRTPDSQISPQISKPVILP